MRGESPRGFVDHGCWGCGAAGEGGRRWNIADRAGENDLPLTIELHIGGDVDLDSVDHQATILSAEKGSYSCSTWGFAGCSPPAQAWEARGCAKVSARASTSSGEGFPSRIICSFEVSRISSLLLKV